MLGLISGVFHSHEFGAALDSTLETSREGIRTVWLSLLILGVTAAIQLAVALASGSVSLLSDTIHNFSDALTALPLWLAFLVGARPPTRRYTYGYRRAEDLAGVAVVLLILTSAGVALWETYQKFLHPAVPRHIPLLMVAGVIGFLGNEAVALLRTRTGRRIGSAALEADGVHARIDGLVSLSVLVSGAFAFFGVGLADPIIGLIITVAILFITKDAAVAMWRRLMDGIEPEKVELMEQVALATAGVVRVDNLRMRWLGHRLAAELHAVVDEDLTITQAHQIEQDVEHRLYHALPQLAEIMVHVDPCGHSGDDHHASTAHHKRA